MITPVPSVQTYSTTAIDDYGVYPAFYSGPNLAPVPVAQPRPVIKPVVPVVPVAPADNYGSHLGTHIDTFA